MIEETQTEYKGFKITSFSRGFEMFQNRFGSIAKFVVIHRNVSAGFAFAVAGTELFEIPEIKSIDLEGIAISKIKEFIDREDIKNGGEYTFEFWSGDFIEVENPDWWVKNINKNPFADVLKDSRFSSKPDDSKYSRYISVLIIPTPMEKTLIPSTPENDNAIKEIVKNEANLLDPKPTVDGIVSVVNRKEGESYFRSTESGIIFLRHSLREAINTLSIRTLLSTTFKALKISHFIYKQFGLKNAVYIKLRLGDIKGNVLTTGSPRRSLSTDDKTEESTIEINEGPTKLETERVADLTVKITSRAIRGFGNDRITEETLKNFLENIENGTE